MEPDVTMADRETIERIRSLVGEACDVDPATIRDDGKLVGYGLDSVRALELVLSLEETFGLPIDQQDPSLGTLTTVVELAEFVARRRDAR